MRIEPIACLSDNYAYLLISESTNEAAIVDASEAPPVANAVRRAGVDLRAIYATHHHFDHVGGNEEIIREFKIDDVVAHASDEGRVPGQTRYVEEGESWRLGEMSIAILHIPGHTLGAIAYVVRGPSGPAAVFTGDTLFLGGCGRLFEGTPAQMHASLSKLAALEPETRVYCGHEYTEANLRFAAHVEPTNEDVRRALEGTRETRKRGEATVPGTLEIERKVNPFLRVDSKEIRGTLGIAAGADSATALGAIREAKNSFK